MSSSGSFCVRSTERDSWPFRTVRRAFASLVSGPRPVCVDGRLYADVPNADIPVDELRDVLLSPGCGGETRHAVWADLVTQSREQKDPWVLACLGLALPALTRVAAQLSEPFAGDPAELHAAVVAGFATELDTIALDRGGIMNRLRWAAYRAGHHAVREALTAPAPTPDSDGDQDAGDEASEAAEAATLVGVSAPSGHPDLVLDRAVVEGLLTGAEAEIIAATRLGDRSLEQAAADRGVTYAALHQARRRAEARLCPWLGGEDEQQRRRDLEADEVATRALESLTQARPASTADLSPGCSLSVSGRRRRTTPAHRVSKQAWSDGVSRRQDPHSHPANPGAGPSDSAPTSPERF